MKVILCILLFSTVFTGPAYAYLDPASGSVLFQIIAAIGVFFALMWRKIKRLFSGKSDDLKKAEDEVKKLIQEDSDGKN